MRSTFLKLNIRLMALLLAAMLLLTTVPAAVSAVETSGDCGAGLTWSFADGRLTISGSGEMTNYDERNLPPWYSYRDQILWLSLPNGLTSVGNMAFYDCTNLTSVTIPNSVTRVGELAFCQNRGMTMLILGSGLKSIGRSAFEQCTSLTDVRLPEGLTAMDSHAFYTCSAITYITVPASVTYMGSGVFAYCHGLLRADVHASMSELPTWTFYGCERLSSVYLAPSMTVAESYAFYGCDSLKTVNMSGENVDTEEMKQKIDEDVPGFNRFGDVNNEESDGIGTNVQFAVDDNGSYTTTNTTATQTGNITMTTSTSTTGEDVVTDLYITATVVSPEGWDELLAQIKTALTLLQTKKSDCMVYVTVYTASGEEIPQHILAALAGTNVRITVHTQSGSRFTVDMKNLGGNAKGSVELSYTISALENVPDQVAGCVAYSLTFHESSTVNAEVMIRLPDSHSRSAATLYQPSFGGLKVLQSVVVDDDGYAHFYLGAVDSSTEYVIAIDVPGQEEEAIFPPELLELLGITDSPDEMEYVVTGRKSSWNMDIGQVTWILMGGMLGTVAIVGVVMFSLNKRKLKKGYVPDLDEETE